MRLLYFIIIGVLAGFFAGLATKGKGFGFVINLLVGIGGAILGGWLFGALNINFGSGILGSLITAFLGAVILLLIIRLFKKK